MGCEGSQRARRRRSSPLHPCPSAKTALFLLSLPVMLLTTRTKEAGWKVGLVPSRVDAGCLQCRACPIVSRGFAIRRAAQYSLSRMVRLRAGCELTTLGKDGSTYLGGNIASTAKQLREYRRDREALARKLGKPLQRIHDIHLDADDYNPHMFTPDWSRVGEDDEIDKKEKRDKKMMESHCQRCLESGTHWTYQCRYTEQEVTSKRDEFVSRHQSAPDGIEAMLKELARKEQEEEDRKRIGNPRMKQAAEEETKRLQTRSQKTSKSDHKRPSKSAKHSSSNLSKNTSDSSTSSYYSTTHSTDSSSYSTDSSYYSTDSEYYTTDSSRCSSYYSSYSYTGSSYYTDDSRCSSQCTASNTPSSKSSGAFKKGKRKEGSKNSSGTSNRVKRKLSGNQLDEQKVSKAKSSPGEDVGAFTSADNVALAPSQR